MKKFIQSSAAATLLVASAGVSAEEVIDNVNVTQIGTYAGDTHHYVWFSARANECANTGNGVYYFNETTPGGKTVLATLTTALVNNRKLLVRSQGCAIIEIYLR